jgi:PAS domain-containing protein
MLGYAYEELVGRRLIDLVPPEEAAPFALDHEVLRVPGSSVTREMRMRRKDGAWVPVLNARAQQMTLDRSGRLDDARSAVCTPDGQPLEFDRTPIPRALRGERMVSSELLWVTCGSHTMDRTTRWWRTS